MPRRSRDPKENRELVCGALEKLYPNPASELVFSNEYELVISVLLSAQCTDKKVNEVTPTLFKRFPDFQRLSRAELAEVEAIIRPINYYRTKARNLLALAETVLRDHSGSLPRQHAELIELPGVGNKTANVVLNELGIKPTLPVDTHVFRLARRLGWSNGKDVEAVESDLCELFPPAIWRNLHHWLILHGRRTCKAPRALCSQCPLTEWCPTASQ